MPLHKIIGNSFTAPWEKIISCEDPSHNPPHNLLLEPGDYVWECPACGRRLLFKYSHPIKVLYSDYIEEETEEGKVEEKGEKE